MHWWVKNYSKCQKVSFCSFFTFISFHVEVCRLQAIINTHANFSGFSPSWGQNWGSDSGMSCPAWCWHTMLAISCLHCCDAARCRADSASFPMISHLGTKSLLGAWCAPSTLPGSPGMAAAGNLPAPSGPLRISLRLRLLERSWGTTPSTPTPVIPRSWGVFSLMLGFPPRRLLPFLSALAPLLPLFLPDNEFCALSFLGSWLSWSGSLDCLSFLWGKRESRHMRHILNPALLPVIP